MSKTNRTDRTEQRRMVAWARRAVHGLDTSAFMVGILDRGDWTVARAAFTLQIGHALLTGKPIVLAVPHGATIPPKLEAAAAGIARYHASDPESITAALLPVLTALGINRQ